MSCGNKEGLVDAFKEAVEACLAQLGIGEGVGEVSVTPNEEGVGGGLGTSTMTIDGIVVKDDIACGIPSDQHNFGQVSTAGEVTLPDGSTVPATDGNGDPIPAGATVLNIVDAAGNYAGSKVCLFTHPEFTDGVSDAEDPNCRTEVVRGSDGLLYGVAPHTTEVSGITYEIPNLNDQGPILDPTLVFTSPEVPYSNTSCRCQLVEVHNFHQRWLYRAFNRAAIQMDFYLDLSVNGGEFEQCDQVTVREFNEVSSAEYNEGMEPGGMLCVIKLDPGESVTARVRVIGSSPALLGDVNDASWLPTGLSDGKILIIGRTV